MPPPPPIVQLDSEGVEIPFRTRRVGFMLRLHFVLLESVPPFFCDRGGSISLGF